MKQNFVYIHALRVIATLAIILLHSATGGIFEEFCRQGGVNPYISLFYKHTSEWAVPAFVLISGAIFLSPQKEIGYNILFGKYIKRIALALLIFGLPMTLAETFLADKDSSFIYITLTSIKEWICGHSWAHMWYLYMLIGLYLITPIIKPFLNKATDKEIRIALLIMFIISSVLPTLKSYGVSIVSYMIISTPFIFIYMLGYYLQWRTDNEQLRHNTTLTFLIFTISLISIIVRIYYGISLNGYIDPACILMAASLFAIFKQFNISFSFAEKLAPYCFCVYLIHTIFINAFYKILHITPLNILEGTSTLITIPIFSIIFTILSFTGAFILMKIPVLKKYIL